MVILGLFLFAEKTNNSFFMCNRIEEVKKRSGRKEGYQE